MMLLKTAGAYRQSQWVRTCLPAVEQIPLADLANKQATQKLQSAKQSSAVVALVW